MYMCLSPEMFAFVIQYIYYTPFGRCKNGPFYMTKDEFELLARYRDTSIPNEDFKERLNIYLYDMNLILVNHDDYIYIFAEETARRLTLPVLKRFFINR